MNDRLCIATVAEHVTEARQLPSDPLEIIDFAVEDDRNRAVLVVHRLLAAGGIDDREPAVTERQTRLEVKPLAIRTAMSDRVGHRPDFCRPVGIRGAGLKDSGNAAHAGCSFDLGRAVARLVITH